ncbi:MAG: hypothetical protein D4R68_00410 [Ignavibacteriales bacterium]|nr:MAG: hypothetical protein D4R68_00410 [Ignavibacteriales bacterium]
MKPSINCAVVIFISFLLMTQNSFSQPKDLNKESAKMKVAAIKTCTQQLFDYVFGEASKDGKKFLYSEFDKNGFITSQIAYDKNGEIDYK